MKITEVDIRSLLRFISILQQENEMLREKLAEFERVEADAFVRTEVS